MAEITAITKTEVAPKQAPAVPGVPEYAKVLVPAGSSVSISIMVDGEPVAIMGPCVSTPKVGFNFLAYVRLLTVEDCATDKLMVEESEEVK